MPRNTLAVLAIVPTLVLTGSVASAATINAGILIKASGPVVHYLSSNDKYCVPPNEATYKAWYSDFSSVKTISDKQLSNIDIANNVTYSPGVIFIKITAYPKVYAIGADGMLRYLTIKSVARTLYGNDWNKKVDDIQDVFFINYRLGTSILLAPQYPAATKLTAAKSIDVDMGASQTTQTLPAGQMMTDAPTIGTCRIFPTDNPWHQDVSKLPVSQLSSTYINSIGAGHPNFRGNGLYGIPFEVVDSSQPKVPINFTAYSKERNHGPYPIQPTAKIERDTGSYGDRHVLILDRNACKLYAMYRAFKTSVGWNADSGEIFDLKTNALRSAGWTSADAAGLPIYPGLIKYEEAAAGAVNHAIRSTASRTQNGYIPPATHQAGRADATLPPIGLRLRLKADFDVTGYTGQTFIMLKTMKKYGLKLADNDFNCYFQGDADPPRYQSA